MNSDRESLSALPEARAAIAVTIGQVLPAQRDQDRYWACWPTLSNRHERSALCPKCFKNGGFIPLLIKTAPGELLISCSLCGLRMNVACKHSSS